MKLGRITGTDYNRVASRAIRRARDEARLSQGDFCVALSDALGLKGKARLKQSTLSGWELGNRQVPAGALLAAAALAGISLSAAVGEQQRGDDLAVRVADLADYVARTAAGIARRKDGPEERRVHEVAAGIRAIVKR